MAPEASATIPTTVRVRILLSLSVREGGVDPAAWGNKKQRERFREGLERGRAREGRVADDAKRRYARRHAELERAPSAMAEDGPPFSEAVGGEGPIVEHARTEGCYA
jgi:hypothetical protein